MIRLILVLSAVALYLILSLPVLFYLRSLEKKRCSCSCFKKPEYGTMDTWDRQKSGGYYL